ncbi:MAG: ribonuclease PH [Ruminococcus sp.]|nr:ribonuclease PH [Ruminococcus sp.]
MARIDGRAADQLRPVEIIPNINQFAEGSCLIRCGSTHVLCCASVEEGAPRHVPEGEGWVTAEYSMLPRANRERSRRDIAKLKLSPRSAEIQRLIGRALRACVDMKKLGERTNTIDCDVLQGDGGTRTASVTGGFVALSLALHKLVMDGVLPEMPLTNCVAAVSAGIVGDEPMLDLCYEEDSHAQVDLNCVMTGAGELVELQGTGEGRPFTIVEQRALVELCAKGIRELQNMGIRVVMLTGDNERTARAIGAQAGVDDVIAGVLPDGKESVIRSLKEQGKVAMVGDGINDAPALTRADIGIAIGAGTDIAIDAADVVLMKSRLSDVPAAVRLSRATLRNIHENLFWAFFYNVIGIPLAAGVWIPIFGWTLNPMFGAAAMSLSSFCVVTNALRLNLFKVHSTARDKALKNPVTLNISHDENKEDKKQEKETKTMVKVTVNVEGMMCGHCEAHVNKAIQAAFGAEDVVSSHESGTTVFTAPEKVDEAKVEEVIKEAGYEFKGITQE